LDNEQAASIADLARELDATRQAPEATAAAAHVMGSAPDSTGLNTAGLNALL
jgi:hypothetical protein